MTKALRTARLDSWENILTGLNTPRDKNTYTAFAAESRVSDETAEALYGGDGVAARICDAIPEHALRKGFEVNIRPDEEEDREEMTKMSEELVKQRSQVDDEIERLEIVPQLIEAAVWANVFGGGGLIIGADDGARGPALMEPLNENNIKSLTHFNVLDKRYMTPVKWYTDPSEPKFGTPKTYLITPFAITNAIDVKSADLSGVYEIHESRMIIFGGTRTSIRRRQENEGWQDSLISRCQKTLRQFSSSWDMLAAMIADGNQAIFTMDGLIDAIASDEQSLIAKRLEMLDMKRSGLRAVCLDSQGETFSRQNVSWGGIREPFDLLMYRLSVDARVPVSLLMGRSPAGMNATGDSDWQNFESEVEAFQTMVLKKALQRIVKLIFLNKSGPFKKEPENWEVQFPALRSMTPMEEIDMYTKKAAGDKTYIDAGVLTAEEVALSRFGPDSGSEISIDIEARLNPEPEPVPPPMVPQMPPAEMPMEPEAPEAEAPEEKK